MNHQPLIINNIHRVQLGNGIRVLIEPIKTVQSVAVGIWVGAGSRYEEEHQLGIAHVIEHMLFKGTRTRTAQQIAEEIEGRGGHLNAFTDKEVTCYYARVLNEHTSIALDVLTDIFLNSVYDAQELEREKGVVLEEMKMYEDSPGDIIHELFNETHWSDHVLGRRVIGKPETVSSFNREMLLEFIQSQYTPDRIVVAAAGNLEPETFLSEVEGLLERGEWGNGSETGERAKGSQSAIGTPPHDLTTTHHSPLTTHLFPKEVEQVHFCLGGDAIPECDDKKYPLAVLNSLLGGNMFSRLWQEIREKRGLAYDIGTYPALYSDRGLFVAYGGTAPETFKEVQALTLQEFEKVKTDGITEQELESGRNQLKGSLLLNLESMQSRMSRLGRTELIYGKVIPLEEILGKIDAVTREDVQALAQEILQPDRLTLTAIVPESEPAL